MTAPDSGYWAFISYSHADEVWARRLHKALERYRIPRLLAGSEDIPRRLYPVFRDREELPTASRLPAKIREALRVSRSLIVVCSPHAAASKWVNEEVKLFKAMGRADRVFCVIVAGEPNASADSGMPEAFPEAVRFDVDAAANITDVKAEPLAADVRKGKDGLALARLKLVAGILGLGLNHLRRRDRRRRIRTRIAAIAAFVVVSGAVGTLLVNEQRETARTQARARAGELVNLAAEFPDADLESKLLLTATAARTSVEGSGELLPEAEVSLYRTLEASRLIGEIAQERGEDEVGGWVWSAVFAPDGERVVFAGPSPTMLYDASLRQATPLRAAGGTLGAQFRPDGTLVTLSEGGSAHFWTPSGELIREQKLHAREFMSISFDPSGDRVVTVGCLEGGYGCRSAAKLWDRDWRQLTVIERPEASVVSAAWVSDGGSFLTLDTGGLLQRWDRDGALLGQFTEPSLWLAPESMNGNLLLTGRDPPWGHGGMFDPLTRVEGVRRYPDPFEFSRIVDLDGETVARVLGGNGSFSPDGRKVVTRRGERVMVWDIEGRPITNFALGEQVHDVAFDPTGTLLAIATESAIWAWTAWGEEVDRLATEEMFGRKVSFSPDGERVVATGCHDAHQGACLAHTLQMWDVGGSLERVIPLEHLPADDQTAGTASRPLIRYSPSGRFLLMSNRSGTSVFDSSRAVVGRLSSPIAVQDAEFSRDEASVRMVAKGTSADSASLVVGVWDWRVPPRWILVRDLDPGMAWADWGPDGRLATVDGVGQATIWDAKLDEVVTMSIGEVGQVPRGRASPARSYSVQFDAAGDNLLVATISDARLGEVQSSDYTGDLAATFRANGDPIARWSVDPMGTPIVTNQHVIVVQCTDRFYGATIGRGSYCTAAEGRVLDLTGDVLFTFDNPLATEWDLTFSDADSRWTEDRLLTVGDSVRLWTTRGDFLGSFAGEAAAFHPQGTDMAVLRRGGWIEIRSVWTSIDEMVEMALGRSLSKVDREQCMQLLGEDGEICDDR